MIRVGINGFGRIGRTLYRLLLLQEDIEVVLVNDIADTVTLGHLVQYDSVHGVWPERVEVTDTGLRIGTRSTRFTQHDSIAAIPWAEAAVDVVIEATGKFKTKALLEQHLQAGAPKVILSAPPESEGIKMIVIGVNEQLLDGTETIVSNASCTTNNAAPMIQLVNELCGIEQAFITTVHSYTTDQSLHDQPHKDLRRARGAAQSIVPTSTGAAKALSGIFPTLRLGGSGIRVPVPDGSLTDLTCYVRREISEAELNQAFLAASQEKYRGVLAYTADPIVSVDVLGNPHSCLFDSQLTATIDRMVKVVGWYDNEVGYSNRLKDLIRLIVTK